MPKKKKRSSTQSATTESEFPKITIMTPLYNRNKWFPLMLMNIRSFDYPKEQMTWSILDSKDGDEDVKLLNNEYEIQHTQKLIHPIKLVYEYKPQKMTIAEKRTYLSKKLKTPWWANMDSDDIYLEQFLKYGLKMCKDNKVGLSGSPQMLFCYPHYDYKITAIECSAARQMHEATMLGTKKYVASMNYFTKNDEKGEGASLVDGNENNVIKTECKECMICIAHNTNTCSKEMFKKVNEQDGAKLVGPKYDLLKKIMEDEIKEGFKDLSAFGKDIKDATAADEAQGSGMDGSVPFPFRKS